MVRGTHHEFIEAWLCTHHQLYSSHVHLYSCSHTDYKTKLYNKARGHQVAADPGNPSRHGFQLDHNRHVALGLSTASFKLQAHVLGILGHFVTFIYIRPAVAFLASGTLPSPPSHHRPMAHRHSESNWKPPPVDQILCNIDAIYASGVFWRVVSPQFLGSQSRLMSAIASMTEKLKAALHPHDPPPPESRPQRYAPQFGLKSSYLPSLIDAQRHCHRRRSSTTPSSRDTNVKDASMPRRSNGSRRNRLSILNPQPRISSSYAAN